MRARFTQSFKIQAVEKALSRDGVANLKELSASLGVGYSTLQRWIRQSRNQEFEPVEYDKLSSLDNMTKEKRPQDWSLDERFQMIMTCSSLDEQAINELCRERGIYPHHLTQWQQDFVSGSSIDTKVKNQSEVKSLKHENKALKKELNRKDKALAETAALLVLQKKVNAIWGSEEDNLQ